MPVTVMRRAPSDLFMDGPAPEEILAQVKHILADPGFSTSDPMRSILLYLATHGMEQPGKPVKEFEIATNALGRGADYDPRSDSTVRVVASRLRSRLAEYYAQEGAADPVIINIPKGAYVLSGTYRQNGNEPPVAEPKGDARRFAISRRTALVASVSLVAGAAGGYFAGRRSTVVEIPWPITTFWREFEAGEPPIIIYSNPVLEGDLRTGLRRPSQAGHPEGPLNEQYTGSGEVVAVRDISRLLSRLNVDARVKRAQLFTWDDAAATDLIFVGGQQQNQPMGQLPKLEKFNLKPFSQPPVAGHGAIKNEHPEPGEEPVYVSSDDAENGTEYAVAALTHGVTPDKRILVLAGVRTLGTEGVATAMCNPVILAEILGKLGVRAGGTVPSFEALFEFKVHGGAPLEAKLRLVYRRRGTSAS